MILRQWLDIIIAAALTCCGLVSCKHKEIMCPAQETATLDVVFSWLDAPGADVEGMTVIFFPLDRDGGIWHFEIPGADGGRVTLPCGRYRMLAFNNDTYNLLYRGTNSFDRYTAYTAPSDITAAMPTSAPAVNKTPDCLYRGVTDDISVTPCGLSYRTTDCGNGESYIKHCGKFILRCCPRRITPRLTCIAEDIGCADNIAGSTALVTGLSESMAVADAKPSAETVAMAIPLSTEDNDLKGSVYTFGHPGGNSITNELQLYLRLKNGDKKRFIFDVTPQIMNASDPMDVIIRLRGITVPPYIPPPSDSTSTGGFDVGVDDWETIIIDLGI